MCHNIICNTLQIPKYLKTGNFVKFVSVKIGISGLNELQADEQDNTLLNASQHVLLQVAITSLVVLAMVCITVCAIMVTVFIMACKLNTAQFTHS